MADPGSPARTVKPGDFLITVVRDGYISVPNDIVTAGAEPDARPALPNSPIVWAGGDWIIFDVGGGTHYQPTQRRLAGNVIAAGLDPSGITKVVFTHAHPDHVWGTQSNDGALLFPNATYYVGRTQWDFWRNPDFLTTMPAGLHTFAPGTRRALDAVIDRLVFLKPGEDVVIGLRALDTTGHTPGHRSFELAGGDGLLIAGDVATSSIVASEHHQWVLGLTHCPRSQSAPGNPFWIALQRTAGNCSDIIGPILVWALQNGMGPLIASAQAPPATQMGRPCL